MDLELRLGGRIRKEKAQPDSCALELLNKWFLVFL